MKAYQIHISNIVLIIIEQNKREALNKAIQRVIDNRAADGECHEFNRKPGYWKWDSVFDQLTSIETLSESESLLYYPGQEYKL